MDRTHPIPELEIPKLEILIDPHAGNMAISGLNLESMVTLVGIFANRKEANVRMDKCPLSYLILQQIQDRLNGAPIENITVEEGIRHEDMFKGMS